MLCCGSEKRASKDHLHSQMISQESDGKDLISSNTRLLLLHRSRFKDEAELGKNRAEVAYFRPMICGCWKCHKGVPFLKMYYCDRMRCYCYEIIILSLWKGLI